VSDPLNSDDKQFMLDNSEANSKGLVLTPQFFKDEEYCGVNFVISKFGKIKFMGK
jgi:hypothetical protein